MGSHWYRHVHKDTYFPVCVRSRDWGKRRVDPGFLREVCEYLPQKKEKEKASLP